ncbi:MAG: adenylyltransferase/cytidyltransferase family protein [Leptolyngbyaceae cyanobacterium RM2_2_4]|nr:adenylyltransferase/cytidyltransferase family protein [Leptolyngbyaceae cyanobacterium RM2_2_4]
MKKRVGIYPGSFNPFHEGHRRVISRGLQFFDKIVLAVGINPEKPSKDTDAVIEALKNANLYGINNGCIEVVSFSGLLVDYINKENENVRRFNGIVRGLRNAQDFEFEKTQLYWNQDLKIDIPIRFLNH